MIFSAFLNVLFGGLSKLQDYCTSWCRLNVLSWHRKYIVCWAFLMESMLDAPFSFLGDCGFQRPGGFHGCREFFFFFFWGFSISHLCKKKIKILHGQHKVWKKSVLLNSLEMGLFHVYVLELKFFCRWASWGRICSWSPDRREILISIACSLGHQHRHPSETVQYLIKWLLLYTFVHLRTQFPATAFIQHPN